ncbi:MAG TPA: proline--tRNA ligase [Elusimicrobiota bacterium]|nr:proline--tRNA ligase [Elusimicrobiota bacterium]
MRRTHYLLPTLKEVPADADTVSAKLMLRAGLIRKVASGIYEWLPFGLRVLRKVERIVREEMDAAGALEVWLPVVQPKELWEETGRWTYYGKELLRLKDRKDTEFCLAPTAEEVITDLVRREVRSYRELPVMLYQFGTKFRDEIRPRFGVMRAREFYMKDAYSFHADEQDAEKYYKRVYEAYTKIFTRCGLQFRGVEADTGTIGGSFSHEFMVLAETGEELMVSCDCGYAANVERAECRALNPGSPEPPLPPEDVSTPGSWSVEDVAKLLKLSPEKFIKTQFYVADQEPVVALVRGDREINEPKLQRVLGCKVLERANDETYRKVAGCEVGYAGPVGLKERARNPKFRLVADLSVKDIVNGVSGSNRKDYHTVHINVGRDYQPDGFYDIRVIREGDSCPRCGETVRFSRGIEVGHTFKLGLKYSQSMNARYLDEKGERVPFVMGCYGIGVSRVVAAAIEQRHDDNGISWPLALAPFQVIVLPLNVTEPNVMGTAEKIYQELKDKGVDVLLDDRDERAGVKFKDADLTGIPVRVTVGEKKLPAGLVEIKGRDEAKPTDVPVSEAVGDVLRRLK